MHSSLDPRADAGSHARRFRQDGGVHDPDAVVHRAPPSPHRRDALARAVRPRPRADARARAADRGRDEQVLPPARVPLRVDRRRQGHGGAAVQHARRRRDRHCDARSPQGLPRAQRARPRPVHVRRHGRGRPHGQPRVRGGHQLHPRLAPRVEPQARHGRGRGPGQDDDDAQRASGPGGDGRRVARPVPPDGASSSLPSSPSLLGIAGSPY